MTASFWSTIVGENHEIHDYYIHSGQFWYKSNTYCVAVEMMNTDILDATGPTKTNE